MEQKFQPGESVRHKHNNRIMEIDVYETKKDFTEPYDFHVKDRAFKRVLTGYVTCRWIERETNTPREERFHQDDLVMADL